jgi:HlyD family secretion protein
VKDVLVKEGDRVERGQALVVLEQGDLDAQRLMAEAQVQQAQAALDKLEHGARPEEIRQARARAAGAVAALELSRSGARSEAVEAQRARLTSAQVAVDKAEVDAQRVRRLFDTGAISKAEVDAVEDGELIVRVYVPETQLALVTPGLELPVSVDSFPNRAFKATVRYVATVGEYTPRNVQTADERAFQVFATRLEFVDKQEVLRAGMAALVKVAH